MKFKKGFYIKAEYKDNIRKIQGGTAQIPNDKMGDAVATIKGYGCDSVILGCNEPTPPTDADLRFIECCDAGELLVIPNCPLVGATGPTLAEVHDPAWYCAQFDKWTDWATVHNITSCIIDFEFYRNHPYAKFRNVAWPPEYIAKFREMLLGVAWKCETGWAFGGMNENKLGYAFIDLCDEGVGLAGEYDESPGAWKNDPELPAFDPVVHTKKATPAPDKFPPYFPTGKLVHSRRWCSRDGDWVCPGSVWQRTWKFSDAADGVLYSDDKVLLPNLGL